MAGQLHRHRLIGDGDTIVRRARERPAQLAATEQLRRQCAPARLARLGRDDAGLAIAEFQGVAQGRREQAAARRRTRINQALDVAHLHARTHGIMDQHECFGRDRIGQSAEAREYRTAAIGRSNRGQHRFAGNYIEFRPIGIVGSEHDHQAADPRRRGQALQCPQQ